MKRTRRGIIIGKDIQESSQIELKGGDVYKCDECSIRVIANINPEGMIVENVSLSDEKYYVKRKDEE